MKPSTKRHLAIRRSGMTRRQALLLGGAGLLAGAGFLKRPAWGAGPTAWQRIDAARALVGDAEPGTEGIALELPLVSEDGSAVPLTVSVESPMTPEDYVESVHLFASRNPSPEIAVFRFTPLAGRAEVATRVRLNESQAVVAIARTSRGELLATSRDVRVTISGCLLRADTYDAEETMRTRVRVPDRVEPGAPAEVLTLINHPMETGLRTGADGSVLPQRIIESLVVDANGEPVFEAELFRSLSANPYIRFFVAPSAPAELSFTWTEDTGETVTASATVNVA